MKRLPERVIALFFYYTIGDENIGYRKELCGMLFFRKRCKGLVEFLLIISNFAVIKLSIGYGKV